MRLPSVSVIMPTIEAWYGSADGGVLKRVPWTFKRWRHSRNNPYVGKVYGDYEVVAVYKGLVSQWRRLP